MRTKCLCKVFLTASALFILIGLECLWTMPTSFTAVDRSIFSCPQWIVGHIIRLFIRLIGGRSAVAVWLVVCFREKSFVRITNGDSMWCICGVESCSVLAKVILEHVSKVQVSTINHVIYIVTESSHH